MKPYNTLWRKGYGAILEDEDPENNFDLGSIQDLGEIPDHAFDLLKEIPLYARHHGRTVGKQVVCRL